MTPPNQDKIKLLAEAMGLTMYKDGKRSLFIVHHRANDGHFDPFTDANDDYAVLEWMRTFKDTSEHSMYGNFVGNDIGLPTVFKFRGDYKIGDYARAALKVIERV